MSVFDSDVMKQAFSEMGKRSVGKRLGGKSKEEISAYMKRVRARKKITDTSPSDSTT